jgi:hypothetical protein
VLAGGPKEQDSSELIQVIDKALERCKLNQKRMILFVKQVAEIFNCHADDVVLAAEVEGVEAGWSSMAEWYGVQRRPALELHG